MKHKTSIVFLTLAALTAGCAKEQTTSQQIDTIKVDTRAAGQSIQDFTFAQKGDFVGKMQQHLDNLNKDLDQLAARMEKSSDSVKAEARPKLEELRAKVAQLNKELDNTRNATESTWDSVKATSQKAFDSFKDGFQQTRQWLSDKIAP
jgi:ElaB/YqjD/DUF883 family membrane-anchored ribosome-binding protein